MRSYFVTAPWLGGVFHPNSVLFPVPRVTLHVAEPYHWPARELARALVNHGFGREVCLALRRAKAVQKASMGGERNALLQRDTLASMEGFPPVGPIVLVDDLVTTGATLFGSALRLLDSYPGLELTGGFAAMRTMSEPPQFTHLRSPVVGSITLGANGWCQRVP